MQVIGQGVHGVVFIAREANSWVAVKRLNLCESGKQDLSVTTLREILCLRKLDHPNVVKLLNVRVDKPYVWIQLECAPITVRDLLSQPLLLASALKFSKELILGIRHCHERNVMHRDIKPENLLISMSNVLKIADFGEK